MTDQRRTGPHSDSIDVKKSMEDSRNAMRVGDIPCPVRWKQKQSIEDCTINLPTPKELESIYTMNPPRILSLTELNDRRHESNQVIGGILKRNNGSATQHSPVAVERIKGEYDQWYSKMLKQYPPLSIKQEDIGVSFMPTKEMLEDRQKEAAFKFKRLVGVVTQLNSKLIRRHQAIDKAHRIGLDWVDLELLRRSQHELHRVAMPETQFVLVVDDVMAVLIREAFRNPVIVTGTDVGDLGISTSEL